MTISFGRPQLLEIKFSGSTSRKLHKRTDYWLTFSTGCTNPRVFLHDGATSVFVVLRYSCVDGDIGAERNLSFY